MRIVKKLSVTVDLSPEEIADIFCDMDEREQALFFSSIAERVKHWENHVDLQILSIVKSSALTLEGLELMRSIGTYANETV